MDGPVKAARDTVKLLAENGINVPVVTGAGTGTYLFECEGGVHTEIQPGSFAFMDADYGANTGMPSFQQSLFVLSTVISKPEPGRIICDAGTKAVDQLSGPPSVFSLPMEGNAAPCKFNMEYRCGGDEHGILVGEDTSKLDVGDKLLLQPSHCDPTVNLYDSIHYIRDFNGPSVDTVFDIEARG
eukprot:CAMPEP_0113946382 /NCGR_PEP_ID=MMETSP1339-20121228/57073_1 /TAXON_ID=94617 /ORGANISM="Fibrocapsa japonica" /LENGTH=183 /DNA_ID=CAMNT_0000952439 /DNA_START=81 /DNA_END=628 /DNA_ORIENTATION=- /assembly_acc=CAM_ASM_000762